MRPRSHKEQLWKWISRKNSQQGRKPFSWYQSGIYNEDITFFLMPVAHGYLTVNFVSIPFGYIYHAKTFIPGQNRPTINMVQKGIDANNNSGIKRYYHLDIPTKYQYFTGITILITTGRLLDTIIDVDYSYPCKHLHTRQMLVSTCQYYNAWGHACLCVQEVLLIPSNLTERLLQRLQWPCWKSCQQPAYFLKPPRKPVDAKITSTISRSIGLSRYLSR